MTNNNFVKWHKQAQSIINCNRNININNERSQKPSCTKCRHWINMIITQKNR